MVSDLMVTEKPESIYDDDYELLGQQYDYDQREYPLPQGLLFIFSLSLLVKCLVPASKGRYIPFLWGSYVWWAEILFIGLTFIIIFYRLFSGLPRLSKDTKRKVLIPILLLGFFQIVSMLWNGQERVYKAYSFIQALMMSVTVLGAVLLISGLSYKKRINITSRLTFILSFVVIIYMGLSFLFPSYRPSSAYMHRSDYTLGFIRIFGPLAPSSTLSFVLFPALSYSISMYLALGRSKLFWGIFVLFIFVAIIATGSRAAILGLMMFVLVFVLVHKIGALKVILPIGILLGLVILVVGIPERYLNFEDNARLETYKTGMRAFTSSPKAIVVGTGHGNLYSRLYVLSERIRINEDRWFLQSKQTEYGFSIYSSHSTPVRLLAETGLTGFLIFVIAPLWLAWRLFGRRYARIKNTTMQQGRIALVGCIATFILIPFDVYIISYSWLSFIWFIYAICAVETIGEAYQQTKMENYYEDNYTLSEG